MELFYVFLLKSTRKAGPPRESPKYLSEHVFAPLNGYILSRNSKPVLS
jgi:hypothetical protein